MDEQPAPWTGDVSYNVKDGLDWPRLKMEHDARLLAQPGGAEILAVSQANARVIEEDYRSKFRIRRSKPT
jgi:hypothetical protein